MSDIAIRTQNLGKLYRTGQYIGYSLREGMMDAFLAPFRRLRHRQATVPAEDDYIWALKDVSFEVKQGEAVGIIGRNGAGKTTLLRVLTRITEPTEGYAEICGRVGSLLEVGTGFHGELTGRENIYLNGAVLGMKKREIDSKFDEIVDFSEVENFIDTPVKRYSSGMQMRLAFAVAAHLEPEILLVDEVLAVGDAAFQKKCLGKMGDVAGGGRAVLLVSHRMEAIIGLCSRAIWLDYGSIVADGPADQVVREYLSATIGQRESQTSLAERTDRQGNGRIRFTGFRLRDERGKPVNIVHVGDTVEFVFSYIVPAGGPVSNVDIWFRICSAFQQRLMLFAASLTQGNFESLPSQGELVCRVPHFPLVPGTYSIDVGLSIGGLTNVDRIINAATLEVAAGDFFGIGKSSTDSPVLCDHSWRFSEDDS